MFGVIAMLVLAHLVLCPRGVGGTGRVTEVVMAAGMAAMAMPSGGPVPRGMWLVAFGAGAAWSALVLVRLGPASGPAGLAMGHVAWRRVAGPAAHHLAASVFMLVAYGVGHGPHTGHQTAAAGHAVHGGQSGAGPASVAGGPLPTPVGVLVGLGFLLWAAWRAVGLVDGSDARPGIATAAVRAAGRSGGGRLVTVLRSVLLSRVLVSSCSIVMGMGMGAMALAMS